MDFDTRYDQAARASRAADEQLEPLVIERIRRIVQKVIPDARRVLLTEEEYDNGFFLGLKEVEGPGGRTHPESSELEELRDDPELDTALADLTRLRAGDSTEELVFPGSQEVRVANLLAHRDEWEGADTSNLEGVIPPESTTLDGPVEPERPCPRFLTITEEDGHRGNSYPSLYDTIEEAEKGLAAEIEGEYAWWPKAIYDLDTDERLDWNADVKVSVQRPDDA